MNLAMPAPMKFSLVCSQDMPVPDAVKMWQACENAGFDMIGIVDSPIIFRELYVAATLAATGTKRAQIMTYVTNPVTRHPSVTAGAMLSLHELAPGRIAMGIGTGDSAAWSVGVKAAKIARIRDYILTVKALLRGERVAWDGQTFEPVWSRFEPFDLKVYVACAGPKVLRMAAEVADGAIVGIGFSDEDIAQARAIIADGSAAAGRSANQFDVWWNARAVFAESVAAAADASLGWYPVWLTMGGFEGKGVPREFEAKVRELNADTHDVRAAYRTPGRDRLVVERAKKLGIYDWLMSRSPRIFGTPADIAKRLGELRDQGLANWVLIAMGPTPTTPKTDLIATLARDVLPRLR